MMIYVNLLLFPSRTAVLPFMSIALCQFVTISYLTIYGTFSSPFEADKVNLHLAAFETLLIKSLFHSNSSISQH
jgi:hypothetical protein